MGSVALGAALGELAGRDGLPPRAHAPRETSLAESTRVAATRWSSEECFERVKGEVGLDYYEVRCWEGWHRHITVCLLAHAFLEVTRADEEEGKGANDGGVDPPRAAGSAPLIAGARASGRRARLPAASVRSATKTASRPPLLLQTTTTDPQRMERGCSTNWLGVDRAHKGQLLCPWVRLP